VAAERHVAIEVQFEGLTVAQANRAASALRATIERALGDDVRAEIAKEREETQDFGSTLVLVLGTPAILTLAKAIHSYVAKFGDRVVIKTQAGSVVATGSAAENIDIEKTVAALKKRAR
jgi:hypothetical protein